MCKTKYRKKYGNNGILEYLQYETEEKYFIFWKRKIWKYIRKPYFSRYFLNQPIIESDAYVNNTDFHFSGGLDGFIRKYPCVDKWFEEAEKEQERLESEYVKREEEYKTRRNKTTYL